MALKIRLARRGAKKRPFYSVVVADVRAPRDGRYIEKIGTFNPLLPKNTERAVLQRERVKHWLSVGAKPTERVLRLMGELGIREYKQKNNPQKGLPGKKAQERIEEKKAKIEAASES